MAISRPEDSGRIWIRAVEAPEGQDAENHRAIEGPEPFRSTFEVPQIRRTSPIRS